MLTEEEKNAGLEGRIIPVNIEQQMKSAYIDYSMSVSYTHLDVYKRQRHGRRSLRGAYARRGRAGGCGRSAAAVAAGGRGGRIRRDRPFGRHGRYGRCGAGRYSGRGGGCRCGGESFPGRRRTFHGEGCGCARGGRRCARRAVSYTHLSATRSDGESARWIFGLLLLFAGIFLVASVVFYYFDWRGDYSALHGIGSENPNFDDSIDNPCGRLGAWTAEMLVGRSFGLFGIVVPIIVTMMGARILRRRPVLFHHSVLSSLLVLILGSLTLGVAFDDGWGMFRCV